MKKISNIFFCLAIIFVSNSIAQKFPFDGLFLNMGNLARISDAESRSISPENFTGEKGKGGMATDGTGASYARELGKGWKISPSIRIETGKTVTLAEIEGPGAVQHIWMTPSHHWRFSILRFYWDGETEPSVEVPVGDFFASGWSKYSQLSSLAICVNPGSSLNCYWIMPFRKSCKITLENLNAEQITLYYQITYTLTDIPEDMAYFHAQFRRSNPLPYKQYHVILDGVKGRGHYVGTYMAWGMKENGWWGEGEVKFFIDGDKEYPTICGTGTEDYFCGSYNFRNKKTNQYQEYKTPYAGMHQVIMPEGMYNLLPRFGLYRWHILDPVRFKKDLKVTVQALGTRSEKRYLVRRDDIASTAFWYQIEPHAPFPQLPDKNALEVFWDNK